MATPKLTRTDTQAVVLAAIAVPLAVVADLLLFSETLYRLVGIAVAFSALSVITSELRRDRTPK